MKAEAIDKRKKVKSKKIGDNIAKGVFIGLSTISIVALLAIFIFLMVDGIPAISEIGLTRFLFGTEFDGVKNFGIFPMVLVSILTMLLSTGIGVLIGLFTAIFIFKYCHKRLIGVVRQAINILAGIPSVIYGLFGLLVIVPAFRGLGGGFGIFSASIVLAIMVMPTIVAISLNALMAVPKHIYEGALALGATKEQALFKAVLPAAKSGIMAAVVLGTMRAVGETMAVVMVIGGVVRMPPAGETFLGIFGSVESLTAIIARNSSYADGLFLRSLISIGLVLFLFSFLLNLLFMYFKRKGTIKQESSSDTLAKKPARKIPFLWHVFMGIKFVWLGIKLFFFRLKFMLIWLLKKIKKGVVFILVKIKIVALYNRIRDAIDKRWHPRKQAKSRGIATRVMVYAMAAVALIALLGVVLYILIQGLPHLSWHFLTGTHSAANPSLVPAYIGTLSIIGIALAIAVPIALGTAIFLSEYASKSRIVHVIRLAIETLAGIPSIVYGLFGLIVFNQLFAMGFSLLGGGLTLSIMILPIMIRTTEESLLAVPKVYREGSVALGASKSRTTFKIVLPAASSGIVTSFILAIGRIMAESAALLFTIGMIQGMPTGITGGGTTMALQIFRFGLDGSAHLASATAVLLLFFVIILNLLAVGLGKLLSRGKKAN